MKNIFKNFYHVAFMLALAGCSFDMPAEQGQGLHITISTGDIDSKTLLPHADFSFYKLILSCSGQTTKTVTINSGNSAVVNDLAEGNWTVSVEGYMHINVNSVSGDYKAASGSAIVSVSSNSFTSCVIEISADGDWDGSDAYGYFTYSINIPGWIDFTDHGDFAYLEIFSTSGYDYISEIYIDLTNQKDDTISLSPGPYLIHIQLYDEDLLNEVGFTEIIHIYPNMETRLIDPFKETDFVKEYITLGGSIGLIIDGNNIWNYNSNNYYINVYADADYSNRIGGEELSGTNFSMQLATKALFMSPLYLVLSYRAPHGHTTYFNLRKIDAVTGQDIDIDFGVVSIVTARGPLTVNGETTLYGEEFYFAAGASTVYAYLEKDFSGEPLAMAEFDGSIWAIGLQVFETETTVYFTAKGVTSSGDYEYLGKCIAQIKDSPKDHIVIDLIDKNAVMSSMIILSGTAAVTINEKPASRLESVTVYTEAGCINEIGRHMFFGGAGAWEIRIPLWEYTGKTLYFGAAAYEGSSYLQKKNVFSVTLDEQRLYLAVGNQTVSGLDISAVISSVALNGTINVLTGGLPIEDGFWIELHADPDCSGFIACCWVEPGENAWTIRIPDDPGMTLYYALNLWSLSKYEKLNRSVTTSGGSMFGINLGTISISNE